MVYYLVFERTQEPQFSSGQVVGTRAPSYSNLITMVEAESEKEAVNLVISSTHRVGEYAVVECQWISFLPGELADTVDGVLRKKKPEPKQLTVAEMREENDERFEKLQSDIDEILKRAND